MYNEDGEWYSLSPTLDDFYYDFRDFNETDCVCPTISQALKWLRDSNAIHIHICLYSKGWYCDVYTFKYYKEDREYGVKHNVQFDEFSTYEEAALAGIEYALDNVI